MASRVLRENRFKGPSVTEALNQGLRDDLVDTVNAFGVLLQRDIIDEPETSGNAVTLAKGTWGGLTIEGEDTVLSSLSNGSKVNTKVKLTSDCLVEGVHFINSDKNLASLIEVDGSGIVVRFIGCTFEKDTNLPADCVDLTDGRIIFVGCLFKGSTGTSGNVVNNSGAATDVQVIGCYNKARPGSFGTATNVGSFL